MSGDIFYRAGLGPCHRWIEAGWIEASYRCPEPARESPSSYARSTRATGIWFGCGLAIGGAILLRPDGGILLASIGGYLLILLFRISAAEANTIAIASSAASSQTAKPEAGSPKPLLLLGRESRAILRAGLLLALGAAIPLIPWTVRNLHTLHRFQPLAPRYANDSDKLVMVGFNRWVKTWMAEYVSVEEIYWNVPGDPIDLKRLPNRAFDSDQQLQQTATLVADYNHGQEHDRTCPELIAFRSPRRRPRPGGAASLLRLAAGRAHCRHVAASAHGIASAGSTVVGVQ